MMIGNDKKNGFTFIELLASITILGILTTVVMVSYSKYLSKARLRYYKSQENLLTLAGKEYFTDFRSNLPTVVGSKTSVDLETLYSKKYIERIKDYNGKICSPVDSDINNRVYAYKVDDGKYLYYTIIECNGYVTAGDSKKPVIVFSPNSIKATNANTVTVKMTITDNAKVEYYSYEIIKDGNIVKKELVKPYQTPIIITFNEEGTYQIMGHAIDSSGNKTNKTSGKYVIDRTPPDCSLIKVESTNGSVGLKWQNKLVKLKITPHSDIDNWNFSNCFYRADNFEKTYCKINGSKLVGSKVKILNGAKSSIFKGIDYNDNGHIYGNIEASDLAGNVCTTNTEEYYIDDDPPVITEKKIISTVAGYNSLQANIILSITDRVDSTDNKIYYSISADNINYSDWTLYEPTDNKVTIPYSFKGTYDGKKRTMYVKVKDDVNNISEAEQIYYTVYRECTKTKSTSISGTCSAATGIGTAVTTITLTDAYTGATCSTTTTSTSCCNAPKVTESAWSACSKSCGGGVQTRTVTTETCDGKKITETKTQQCNTKACPVATCSISLSGGTVGENGWYKGGTVKYTMTTTNATAYGVSTSSTTDYNGKTSGTIKKNGTYTIYGKVKNVEGTEGTCSATVKYDKTAPACPTITSNVKEKTWTKNKIKLTFAFSSDTVRYDWYTNVVKNDTMKLSGAKSISETTQTMSAEGKRRGAVVVYDEAGNASGLCGAQTYYYLDRSNPTIDITTYKNYKGVFCVDRPNITYAYRYDINMTDANSGIKSTNCEGGGITAVWPRSGTNTSSLIGVREQFCLQSAKKITCKACDNVGHCVTKTIN